MAEVQPQQQGGATPEGAPANGAQGQQSAYNVGPYGNQYAYAGNPPPARRPCDPCCGCCGSIRTSVIIWDIVYWISALLLLLNAVIALCLKDADFEKMHMERCSLEIKACSVALSIVYLVAVIVLTVAIFASSLGPQTRILLTIAFYISLLPFVLIGIASIIIYLIQGCYETTWNENKASLIVGIAVALLLYLLELVIGYFVGRANIYCIKEKHVPYNSYNGIEQRSQVQSQAEGNRQ